MVALSVLHKKMNRFHEITFFFIFYIVVDFKEAYQFFEESQADCYIYIEEQPTI